jgi:zinc transport system ATP-binding protein
MIDFNHVSVKYGNLTALKNIDFKLYKQDFLYIIGPNGGGKSTLVKSILNLVKPSAGTIDITTKKIGYLPQTLNSKSNFPITVSEVIYSGFNNQRLFVSKKDHELIDKWLIEMDLLDYKNEMMATLSGGQQQRVFFIRSIISNPEILILDEPTSALDPDFRTKFYKLIHKLNDEGMTIIFVTHDVNNLDCDNHILMYVDQEVKYFGSLKDFKSHNNGGHDHV